MSDLSNRVIYVLRLESEKYYVGSLFLTSENLEAVEHPRILKHFHGLGAEWTKLHVPIEVIQIIAPADEFEEDKQTKIHMSKYGIDNVRGGSYCEINLSNNQVYCLKKEIATAKGLCFRCNQVGHLAKTCGVIVCYKCGKIGHYSPQCDE
jgi:hypothetical protein